MSAVKSILKPTPPRKRKGVPTADSPGVKRVKFEKASALVTSSDKKVKKEKIKFEKASALVASSDKKVKKEKIKVEKPFSGPALISENSVKKEVKVKEETKESKWKNPMGSPASQESSGKLNLKMKEKKKGTASSTLIKSAGKKKGPESIKFGKPKRPVTESKIKERKKKSKFEIVPAEPTPVMKLPGSSDQAQAKKSAKERKAENAEKRRKVNPNYDLAMKAKQIWENVRRKDCSKLKRAELVVEMYNLVKDRLKEIIFTPDMVRVIECLMAVGTEQIKEAIFSELKNNMLDLTKSKYSKFFMLKALKYGSKEQKRYIMKIFNGKVVELVRHSEASAVVECAYNEHANAAERSAMVEEFYGPNFALFKDGEVKSLAKMLEKEPSKKEAILTFMKDALLPIVEKSVVRHSIVHHVLYEYMMNCDNKARAEMIESVRDVVVQILHTQDGARVATQCIFHGSVKDRKVIVKSMKSHVVKICKEEHGHIVLLAIFDNVDDTVLIRNIILREIMLNGLEISTDPHGRKVILHLLSPRDLRFFIPHVVAKLQQADGNEHSRKEPTRRHEELCKVVAQPFLQLVAAETSEMIRNSSNSIVAGTILQKCTPLGDPRDAYTAISAVVAEPFVPGNVEKYHIIEDAAGHMFIKRLIVADKERYQDGLKVLFSEILLNIIPEGTIESWLDCNRGAFILICLLETEIPTVVALVRNACEPLHKKLKKKSYQAAKILLKKLKGA